MLDELLSRLDFFSWAPAVIGALCASLVLLAGRRSRPAAPPPAPEPPAPPRPLFGPDPFTSGSPSDKRSAPRRRGSSVPVFLGEDGGRGAALSGVVVDRSRGGLGMAVDAAVPAGAVLGVRARAHAREMPWVSVRVRHCRRDGAGWVLGCQFLQPPPWNVLLLFG
jgi:hypothetical protein